MAVGRSGERTRTSRHERWSCRPDEKRGVRVALLLTAGCGTTNDAPSSAERTAYSESDPPVGEAVQFFLYTHCGVESLSVGGRWWHAVEPLYGENGPGDSPDGWGDPYQEGELTLNSEDAITFEAKGKNVEFVPAPEDKPMRICS